MSFLRIKSPNATAILRDVDHRCGLRPGPPAAPASLTAPHLLAIAALLGIFFLSALPALAHPIAPGLLRVDEIANPELISAEGSPAKVEMIWRAPAGRAAGVALNPLPPSGCQVIQGPFREREQGAPRGGVQTRWLLECGEGTSATAAPRLTGRSLEVAGLERSPREVLVFVRLADDRTLRTVLSAENPRWQIPAVQGKGGIARQYFELGVEHILIGIDHLVFLLALLLLVRPHPRWARTLLVTVTGFTLGHSVTLALAVLGVVAPPSGPVEIAIAASILVLAVELRRSSETLLHRKPWLAAIGFGLLHGFGFAGVLAELGLPRGEVPLALATFNLGIEAGQLLFVAACVALLALLAPLSRRLPPWTAELAPAAIGVLASYWIFERWLG
ncbi:MAG: HupE/UreJ family protein [Acidobacteriota bacterium]